MALAARPPAFFFFFFFVAARAAAGEGITGSLAGGGLKLAVVVGRFNEFVTRPLLAGALEAFARHGVDAGSVEVGSDLPNEDGAHQELRALTARSRRPGGQVIWVPGSFEIPVVAQAVAESHKFDAVLCLGAVIRGATTHYDAVANGASGGVLSASLKTGVPCIFGVLTCDTMEQAIDRAGGKAGNKGAEAAVTAIEMGSLMAKLRAAGMTSTPPQPDFTTLKPINVLR
eukprot:SM000001S04596  [mRNA]  locus=s1:1159695:1161640:- [translate_table: standard]